MSLPGSRGPSIVRFSVNAGRLADMVRNSCAWSHRFCDADVHSTSIHEQVFELARSFWPWPGTTLKLHDRMLFLPRSRRSRRSSSIAQLRTSSRVGRSSRSFPSHFSNVLHSVHCVCVLGFQLIHRTILRILVGALLNSPARSVLVLAILLCNVFSDKSDKLRFRFSL